MKLPPIKRIAIFIVAALVLTAGFKLFRGHSIEVTHPVKGPAVHAVYATGTVEPTVMLPIAPRIAARLLELNTDEGRDVLKDEVLARLEDDNYKHASQEIQSKLEYAQKNFDRTTDLLKKGYVSKDALDKAEAELEAAKAATAKAEAEAGFMKLVAPADGKIIKRDGEIGQLIPANQPVFWLSCCAPLRISAEVDEEDIALVKEEQKVLIRADAFPGKVFNGKVQAITPKGDPVARSYRVRIEFTEDNPLLIGMTAETNIVVSEKNEAMLIPESAVKNNSVWIIKDGRLAKMDVEIGAKGGGKAEVKSGLTFDDLVVTEQNDKLKEGKRISYTEKKE